MKTTDLFKNNRSAKRLNESLAKTFGKSINFESFDTEKLEDARNKLRTQIYTARSTSGFNETVENDTLTKAQWMHDAIVAELMDREEHIVGDRDQEDGSFGHDDDEDEDPVGEDHGPENPEADVNYGEYDREGDMAKDDLRTIDGAAKELYAILDADENLPEWVQAKITKAVDYIDTVRDYMKANKYEEGMSEVFDGDKETGTTHRGSRVEKTDQGIKHTKTDYDDGNGEPGRKPSKGGPKSRYYSTPILDKEDDDMRESNNKTTGDNMRNLREGEIQQASAIVTAKTMVDRVSRWIEELSGMENDTLLQLGDSIRDEMGQEQAKQFISAVAPAIQQALELLKTTREALSTGVRALTGEEQPTDMLGAEPGMDIEAPAEPDSMNPDDMGMDDEGAPEDEFGASDAGAGGLETAGREQRESINRSNSLLKVLAG